MIAAALDEEFTVGEDTILAAFDYAIGRKTYVVSSVVRDLQDNYELLTSKSRQYMIKEIERRWEVNELGHDIDKQHWLRLLQQLKEIEELV